LGGGDDLYLLFVGPLNKAGLEYMVTRTASAIDLEWAGILLDGGG
jgi:hypothetical protein